MLCRLWHILVFLVLSETLGFRVAEAIEIKALTLDFGEADRTHSATDSMIKATEPDRIKLSAQEVLADALMPTGQATRLHWVPNLEYNGFIGKGLWLVLSINPYENLNESPVFFNDKSFPHEIDYYVFDERQNLLKHSRAGAGQSSISREFFLNKTGIKLPHVSHQTFYIVVRTFELGAATTSFALRLESHFRLWEWCYLGFYGLYFGLALALFFHNLSLFFSLKDKLYLAYCAFVLSTMLLMGFSSGFYGALSFLLPAPMQVFPYTSPAYGNLTSTVFCMMYLRLWPNSNWITRLIFFVNVLTIVSLLGFLLHPWMAGQTLVVLNVCQGLLLLVMMVDQLFRGQKHALYLLVASLFPVFAMIIFFFWRYVLKASVPTDIMALGFGLEMLLMSAALSFRVYSQRQSLLMDLQALNATLEDKVQQRTSELEHVNVDLQNEIKQRKIAQAQIESHQSALVYHTKMRALGEMSGGVAHEINNPLMIIAGYANIISKLTVQPQPPMEKIFELAGRISRTTDRIANIVSSLRNFAAEGLPGRETEVSVKHLFEQMEVLCIEKIRKNGIDWQMKAIAQDIVVLGHSSRFLEAFLAIVSNAIEALDQQQEGVIRLSHEIVRREKEMVLIVRIQDNGKGIPQEIRDRIFEPFFTTKPVGSGTGLGLSMALGVFESCQGRLYLDKNQALTCFVVEMPCREVQGLSVERETEDIAV